MEEQPLSPSAHSQTLLLQLVYPARSDKTRLLEVLALIMHFPAKKLVFYYQTPQERKQALPLGMLGFRGLVTLGNPELPLL